MTKTNALILCGAVLLIVVVGLIVFHRSTNAPGSGILADRALNVIDSLQAGDYRKATRDFADQVAPIFGQRLPALWPSVAAKVGPLKARAVTRAEGSKVYVTCTFERATLWCVVEFDAANKIINFSMYGHPV